MVHSLWQLFVDSPNLKKFVFVYGYSILRHQTANTTFDVWFFILKVTVLANLRFFGIEWTDKSTLYSIELQIGAVVLWARDLFCKIFYVSRQQNQADWFERCNRKSIKCKCGVMHIIIRFPFKTTCSKIIGCVWKHFCRHMSVMKMK